MPAFVALFRAVNVGGRAKIAMRDLRDMASRSNLAAPRTLLQSGNLVFSSDMEADALEQCLEAAARSDLALETNVFVRSAEAWAGIVAACPYPEYARSDPSHLVAMLLRRRPTGRDEAELRSAIVGREDFELRGTTAYMIYPDGIGRSKLTVGVVERRLGTIGTARNWNTVLRIGSALGG